MLCNPPRRRPLVATSVFVSLQGKRKFNGCGTVSFRFSPLASLSIFFSFSRSSFELRSRKPKAPVTILRAICGHVCGRAMYGSSDDTFRLAFSTDCFDASFNGRSFTNGCCSCSTLFATGKNYREKTIAAKYDTFYRCSPRRTPPTRGSGRPTGCCTDRSCCCRGP